MLALPVFVLILGFAHYVGAAERPYLVLSSGDTVQATHDLTFPLMLETSSLCYDPSDSSFYSTIDKGEPHIVQFRIEHDSIVILRTGSFIGLNANLDFEGITLVHNPLQGDIFYVSTERPWSNDSLMIVAVAKSDFRWLDALSFFLKPEGMGVNNNLEGIASTDGRTFYLGKEWDPAYVATFDRRTGTMNKIIDTGFFPATAKAKRNNSGPADSGGVDGIPGVLAVGDLAQLPSGDVLILNRYERSIALLEINPVTSTPVELLTGVLPNRYLGVDDVAAGTFLPDQLKYGLAEGLAAFENAEDSSAIFLCVITDPGFGAYPRLVIWPSVPFRNLLGGIKMGRIREAGDSTATSSPVDSAGLQGGPRN